MPDSQPPSEDALRAALQSVQDPEIDESIVDLGLVERIDIGADHVSVTLVPTSATCPMADVLIEDATAALQAVLPAGFSVDVDLDFDLSWTPDRMKPSLRARFGWGPGGGG